MYLFGYWKYVESPSKKTSISSLGGYYTVTRFSFGKPGPGILGLAVA